MNTKEEMNNNISIHIQGDKREVVEALLQSIKDTDNVKEVYVQTYDVEYDKVSLLFVVNEPDEDTLLNPNYSVGYNDFFNEHNLGTDIELKVVRADNLEKSETHYYKALKLTLGVTSKLLWTM